VQQRPRQPTQNTFCFPFLAETRLHLTSTCACSPSHTTPVHPKPAKSKRLSPKLLQVQTSKPHTPPIPISGEIKEGCERHAALRCIDSPVAEGFRALASRFTCNTRASKSLSMPISCSDEIANGRPSSVYVSNLVLQYDC